MRLAEALDPFVPLENSVNFVESNYDAIFNEVYLGRMAEKLGFQGDEIDDLEI